MVDRLVRASFERKIRLAFERHLDLNIEQMVDTLMSKIAETDPDALRHNVEFQVEVTVNAITARIGGIH